MDQYEGREEGVFPNRVPTLFGEHESQTKAQRTWHRLAVPSPFYTHAYFPSRVSAPMELGIKKKRHSPTKSIQQRNHCAEISASCLPNKSHNAAGMGDDLEKISKSLEEAMPDTETWDLGFPPPLYTHAYFPSRVSAPMELGIKKKRHSPTKSIQQRNHYAKISASCLPNKSHNAAGMGDDLDDLEKILKSFEEAMPDTEKNWGENSDVLERLRSSATQRDFASGDLPEFGQSYGCPQTDNTRFIDNNVDETFYNRE